MPKSRISSSERKTRRSSAKTLKPGGEFVRFLGLSLSGGKSDKSCLAVLDFYPSQKRIFLSSLHEKIRSEEMISADLKIFEMVEQLKENAKSIAMDAPLSLPICVDCPCGNVGFETCHEPEVKWMRLQDQSLPKRKPKKIFTPYTQRPVDLYLSILEEENLEVQHALGANLAPVTARAHFLKKRMTLPCLEVNPKIAVWRMGTELKVQKNHLRSYRNSVGGEEGRRAFLTSLIEESGLFIYQADFRTLCENSHAFEALICAWVASLKDRGQTELPPKGFPEKASWVEVPKQKTF